MYPFVKIVEGRFVHFNARTFYQCTKRNQEEGCPAEGVIAELHEGSAGAHYTILFMRIDLSSFTKQKGNDRNAWGHPIFGSRPLEMIREASGMKTQSHSTALRASLAVCIRLQGMSYPEAFCQELSENGTPLSFAVMRGVRIRGDEGWKPLTVFRLLLTL